MNLLPASDLIEGAGFAAECALLFVVLKRSLWKTMPAFALLCIFTPLEDLILVPASRIASKNTYFWAFWIFAIGDYAVQLTLVAEIARSMLRPAGQWIRTALQEFAWWSAVGTATAVFAVMRVVPYSSDLHEMFYRRISLFTSLLTCVYFLSLTGIANKFRIPRRSHTKAVGQGLAVWNIACISDDVALTTGASSHMVTILDNARMVVWTIVLVYWVGALWVKEQRQDAFPMHIVAPSPFLRDDDSYPRN